MLPALFRSPPSSGSEESESRAAPFVLERRALDLKADGTFTPEAIIWLTPALLESGLLQLLSPTELQTLLLVLCSVTANGDFVATSESLAAALHLWPGQMRARLEQLISKQWMNEPLLRCQTTTSGLRLFSPSSLLLSVRHNMVFPAQGRGNVPLEQPSIGETVTANAMGGLKEAVVEHSRTTYGRPRAEVEAEINQFLNSEKNPATMWPGPTKSGSEDQALAQTAPLTPEEEAKREMGRRLMAVGISTEQARFLVDSFPAELIERQLAYLPYRQARNPAGMLVASIEGDYAPPLAARTAGRLVATELEVAHQESYDGANTGELPQGALEVSGETGEGLASLLPGEEEMKGIPLPPSENDG